MSVCFHRSKFAHVVYTVQTCDLCGHNLCRFCTLKLSKQGSIPHFLQYKVFFLLVFINFLLNHQRQT